MRFNEAQAWEIVEKIRQIVKEHGLWVTVLTEEKPDLKMIRIQEISIRVEK